MTYYRTPYKTNSDYSKFRPLLAATLESEEKLHSWRELAASPKLDGIRCIILNGQAMSRNMKPIPNKYIQKCLSDLPDGLDGELIVGPPTGLDVFNRTSSGVMSIEGEPDFYFYVFDHALLGSPYVIRYNTIKDWEHEFVKPVLHVQVRSPEQVRAYEQDCLEQGYEGIMIRCMSAPYKQGRSTHREGILWKLKRFHVGEARILKLLEGQHNTNELVGSTRSQKAEGMVPNGRVGTIVAQDLQTKQVLNISPGVMTHHEREYYLGNPSKLIGKIASYRAFMYGAIDAPRFATFRGIRDEGDI